MYERTSLMCTLFYIHHILYVVQKKMLLMLNIHICILNFTYTRARFMNDASATFRSRQQFPATRDASVANFIFRFSCMNASLSGTFHECQQNSIQQWQWRWGMTTWTSPIMLAVLWLSIIYCHLAWLMITGTQIGSNAYFSRLTRALGCASLISSFCFTQQEYTLTMIQSRVCSIRTLNM